MKAGTWLCPHCYEHEHPSEGWMCNSSICMKRRGFAPTGIAIYDAQKRGFQSVAHWLQVGGWALWLLRVFQEARGVGVHVWGRLGKKRQ
jgi:hypothetical protein